jgi:Domain of Unknown Function (DUF1080)
MTIYRLSLFALAALAVAPIHSQDADKPPGKTLFDGKSLDGWAHLGPGKMVIEDGAIRTEGGMGLLWYTREKFGDCILRVVYKTTAKSSNSGVFIRVADKPDDPWFAVHHGYEVQICDGADPFHATGAVYSMSKVSSIPSKVGEWNTMDITLKGQRILVSLNGEQVQDFNPETATIPARTKDYEPERGPRPTAGYIGLQNHDDAAKGTQVYFKEVRILPLKK